jgi:hypothetical protein
MPVMAVDHIRLEVNRLNGIKNGSAEKREPFPVIIMAI